jgi:hypothetical protein
MLKKVTKFNFKPSKDNGRFLVYSKQFNELIDDLTDGSGDLAVADIAASGDLTVTGRSNLNGNATFNGNTTLGNASTDTLRVIATTTFSTAVIQKNVGSAINATATATAAQVKGGLITSTSAAAVTITLPTGTDLGAALAATQGTVFDLVIDNTAGANTVTLAVGANNIQSAWSVYQDVGGATLDVVSGVTGTAVFRFVFSSATACTFCRIA